MHSKPCRIGVAEIIAVVAPVVQLPTLGLRCLALQPKALHGLDAWPQHQIQTLRLGVFVKQFCFQSLKGRSTAAAIGWLYWKLIFFLCATATFFHRSFASTKVALHFSLDPKVDTNAMSDSQCQRIIAPRPTSWHHAIGRNLQDIGSVDECGRLVQRV